MDNEYENEYDLFITYSNGEVVHHGTFLFRSDAVKWGLESLGQEAVSFSVRKNNESKEYPNG